MRPQVVKNLAVVTQEVNCRAGMWTKQLFLAFNHVLPSSWTSIDYLVEHSLCIRSFYIYYLIYFSYPHLWGKTNFSYSHKQVPWSSSWGKQGTQVCCCSVAKSCLTLCDPLDCSMLNFPVLHCLLEFAQVHVHWTQVCLTLKSVLCLCPIPWYFLPFLVNESLSFAFFWYNTDLKRFHIPEHRLGCIFSGSGALSGRVWNTWRNFSLVFSPPHLTFLIVPSSCNLLSATPICLLLCGFTNNGDIGWELGNVPPLSSLGAFPCPGIASLHFSFFSLDTNLALVQNSVSYLLFMLWI